MNRGFIEVVIPISQDYELEDRWDLEESINNLLEGQNLGEVSGVVRD